MTQPAAVPRAATTDTSRDHAPLFVVTSGRAGSTMLARMLHRHPELVCISDLIEPIGPLPLIDASRQVSAREFLNVLCAPSLPERTRFWRSQPTDELLHLPTCDDDVSLLMAYTLPFLQPDDPEALREELIESIGRRDPATMRAHLLATFGFLRDRFGASRWVERTGGSLPHAHRLVRAFPHGRFVHLHRDPAETAVSMQRGSFFRLYNLLESDPALELWDWTVVPEPHVLGEMVNRWEVQAGDAWSLIPEDQFLRISYEDLMTDATRQLLRLLEFLLERPPKVDDRSWAEKEAKGLRPAPLRVPFLDPGEQHKLTSVCYDSRAMLGYA